MNNLLKLRPNVPVEIALSCADGINVVSPRGTPAVKYTLVDGRTFFATAYVAAKFRKLNIEAHERIALCVRNIDGKSITLVERVTACPDADTSPASALDVEPERPADPELVPPTTIEHDSPSAEQLNDLRDDIPTPNSPPVSQLERALKTTIQAAHIAEKYGKEIGYAVRFDQESIKCMAITVLIGMQGGRQ